MALEFSEIAMLGCMFYKKKDLVKAGSSTENLVSFVNSVKKLVDSTDKIKFGSSKASFVRAMNPAVEEVLDDFCRGISGAIATKEWLTKHHNEPADTVIKAGYMTGNVWPSPVDAFKFKAFGMADYNSSDIILYTGKQGSSEYFYGVSLKKKNTEYAPDPTIINKAFDTIMDGPQFDAIKDKLKDVRVEWFANKVREADKLGLIEIEDRHKKLNDADLLTAKPMSEEAKGGKGKQYVNLKGTLAEGYDNKTASFKKWMNKEVGTGNLFTQLVKIIEPHMEMFANSLINLVFKAKLNDKLNANRDLDKYYFGFTLATGVGKHHKKNGPSIGKGQVYPQESVLCALSHLAAAKKPYKMVQVPNPAAKEDSVAAKVFFEIRVGKVKLLDLQLRYKGDFKSQPQFFAFMTDDFKALMKGKCLDP
tara:strand:- start:388 stop:1647 length:1260 start_codon:yes stop_codon:yes gene_type:complete